MRGQHVGGQPLAQEFAQRGGRQLRGRRGGGGGLAPGVEVSVEELGAAGVLPRGEELLHHHVEASPFEQRHDRLQVVAAVHLHDDLADLVPVTVLDPHQNVDLRPLDVDLEQVDALHALLAHHLGESAQAAAVALAMELLRQQALELLALDAPQGLIASPRPQLPDDDLAGGLQVPARLGVAAREARHGGVEGELGLLGARGESAVVQLGVEAVEDGVGAQRLERGRDRLEGVDAQAARLPAGEEREEADVRSDVEDAVAVVQLDAVAEVDRRLEDFLVEDLGLEVAQHGDLHAVGQDGALAAGEPSRRLLRRQGRAQGAKRSDRDHVRHQDRLAGPLLAHGYRRRLHGRMRTEGRFDLAQLDAVAADFDLMIDPAQELQDAVRAEPRAVAGGVEAAARLDAERIRNEPLGRQVRAPEVARTTPCPPMNSSPGTPGGAGVKPRSSTNRPVLRSGRPIGTACPPRPGGGTTTRRSSPWARTCCAPRP